MAGIGDPGFRDTGVMRRNVAAALEVEITAATTLEFQIAVAPHPGTEVWESLSFVLDGNPVEAMEISGVHGNRIHKLDVPAGYLSVDYSATIIGQTAMAPVTEYDRSMYLRPSRYAEADKFYGFAATEFRELYRFHGPAGDGVLMGRYPAELRTGFQ